jgi:hypothetical protein
MLTAQCPFFLGQLARSRHRRPVCCCCCCWAFSVGSFRVWWLLFPPLGRLLTMRNPFVRMPTSPAIPPRHKADKTKSELLICTPHVCVCVCVSALPGRVLATVCVCLSRVLAEPILPDLIG